jgi:hypothetical protein
MFQMFCVIYESEFKNSKTWFKVGHTELIFLLSQNKIHLLMYVAYCFCVLLRQDVCCIIYSSERQNSSITKSNAPGSMSTIRRNYESEGISRNATNIQDVCCILLLRTSSPRCMLYITSAYFFVKM